jgi:hypothetical protein
MISKSTITIFLIIFALLGLLLGFAESVDVSNSERNVLETAYGRLRIDPDRLAINVTDDEIEVDTYP